MDDAPSDLARLQQAVLVAVLSDRPVMPGGPPLQLPDLQFARDAGGYALSPENLGPGVDVAALPRPVHLVSDRAGPGHIAFAPAQVTPDTIALTLQVRASPGQGQRAQPIASLQVRFTRENGGWQLADAPAQSAN